MSKAYEHKIMGKLVILLTLPWNSLIRLTTCHKELTMQKFSSGVLIDFGPSSGCMQAGECKIRSNAT